MKITQKWLEKFNACSEAKLWVSEQHKKDEFHLIKKAARENHFNWANWYISRRLNKMRKVRYAIFAAELVLKIFEDKQPNDKRPRNAIEGAKKYLKDPCRRTKQNARTAAYAADAAADVIGAAGAYAAYAAANAACAAGAAADAADADAACAATDAIGAAGTKVKKEIIKYGVKLIKEMKQNEI